MKLLRQIMMQKCSA